MGFLKLTALTFLLVGSTCAIAGWGKVDDIKLDIYKPSWTLQKIKDVKKCRPFFEKGTNESTKPVWESAICTKLPKCKKTQGGCSDNQIISKVVHSIKTLANIRLGNGRGKAWQRRREGVGVLFSKINGHGQTKPSILAGLFKNEFCNMKKSVTYSRTRLIQLIYNKIG